MAMSIIKDDCVVSVLAKKTVVAKELLAVLTYLYSSEEKIRKTRCRFCDYSAVSGCRLSNSEIQTLAIIDRDALRINPGMFIIRVAADDLMFGLCRMWELHSGGSEGRVFTTRDRSRAVEWLRCQGEHALALELERSA